MTLGVSTSPTFAEALEDGDVTISPSNPSEFWTANRALFPGESVTFSVTVEESENHDDKEYELDGEPTVEFLDSNSIWSRISESGYEFKAANAGVGNLVHTVEVYATWKAASTPQGGPGPAPESDTIDGVGSGVAYTQIPVFVWHYPDKRMEFSDGQSVIEFELTASAEGATLDMDGFNVDGPTHWVIEQQVVASENKITGTVTSQSPGKGRLKVEYSHDGAAPVVLDTSDKEISYSNHDLAIVTIGGGSDDLNDHKEHPEPNDMSPGSMLIASLGQDPGDIKRSRITLIRNEGNPDEGTYKLKIEDSDKLAIYSTAQGGNAIDLENTTWTGEQVGNGLHLHVGPIADYAHDAGPQEATITLTYEQTLGDDSAVETLDDTVSVRILPLEIVEVIETGESAGCTGYDKNEKALMVPMQGSNKIKVKIAGAPQEILQNIKFVSEPAGKLTIAPEEPTAAEQELTISGTTSALGVEVKLEIDGVKVDLFEADVLKQKNVSLNVRAIINKKTGVVVSTPPVDDITEHLELFLHQANVIFDEITVNNIVIDYDKNGDGAFNYTIHGLTGFTELDRLYEKAPRTDNIDYYIFKNINPGGDFEAVYINSQNIIVAKDNHDKCTPLFIMAHEIGHALGRTGHWDNKETHADYLMANGKISNCVCAIGRSDWRAMNNQD